jgi:hypothetical protein
MRKTVSAAEAAEAKAAEESLRARAARQAATRQAEETPPDVVKARVTKLGDAKISMGVHVPGVGEACYEHNEILEVERKIALDLEARGFAEIIEAVA